MEQSIKDRLNNKMDEIEEKFNAILERQTDRLSEMDKKFKEQLVEIKIILDQITLDQNYCKNCELCCKDGGQLGDCELVKRYINGN